MAGRENKEEKSRLGKNQRKREEIMRDMPGARSQAVRHRDSKKVRKVKEKKPTKKPQQNKNF